MSFDVLDYDPPRRWAAASVAGGFVFLAGETGTDPVTMEPVAGGIEEQVAQTMRNIEATLARLGLGMDAIVRLTMYLTDMEDLPKASAARRQHLPRTLPSTAVQVCALAHPDLLVEIDAIAVARPGTPGAA
ncbi:MAG: RidA family protein [Chloroflexi bacterium]|nr:RidA family protein [Chloroflexota bacterium]